MSCRSERGATNPDGMTDLFGSGQMCVIRKHGGQPRLNVLGKRGRATGLHADMERQLFRGGGEITLVSMKHLFDEVDAFVVVVQQLETDIYRITE